MDISHRPSIHTGGSQQLSQVESDPEQSKDYQDDSQSFSLTNSTSDDEAFGSHRQSPSPEVYRRKKSGSSYCDLSTPESPKKNMISSGRHVPETRSFNFGLPNITTILLVFMAICVFYCMYEYTTGNMEKTCTFEKLRKFYPEQEYKVWKYLTSGIELILNKRVNSPGVYLFVHQGGERATQLVRNIATHSSSCFGHDMRPVEMESNDFNSNEVLIDYGYAIKKFKEKIKKGNVILIANLNQIPGNAARALHTICDTISPIAPNVVIYLTLTVSPIDGGNVESITEDALKRLWGQDLAYNELDPLITRVTDQVIALKS